MHSHRQYHKPSCSSRKWRLLKMELQSMTRESQCRRKGRMSFMAVLKAVTGVTIFGGC